MTKAFLVFLVFFLCSCDRLANWADIVEESDNPPKLDDRAPPPPSPATTPDGRCRDSSCQG